MLVCCHAAIGLGDVECVFPDMRIVCGWRLRHIGDEMWWALAMDGRLMSVPTSLVCQIIC